MKLPVISGKEAIRALEKAGFVVVRQKGSHVRIEKVTSKNIIKITVPFMKPWIEGLLKVSSEMQI
ncbi:MAG TPA: type II toxin-antitoxin system HicA family toxin [Candidatus Methanoperedens sp.]